MGRTIGPSKNHVYDPTGSMTLDLITLLTVLAAVALIAGYAIRYGNPPTPTSPRVCRTLIGALPPLKAGVVYELGAGWGNLALVLAERYPKRTVVAIEASPLPCLVARIWAVLRGCKNLNIERGDMMRYPLIDAALVVCYVDGPSLARLRLKLDQELPSGAIVVSHTFKIDSWTPQTVATADDIYSTPIYVYEFTNKLPGSTTSSIEA